MNKMISSTISILTSVVLMFAGSATVYASDTDYEGYETRFGEIMLSDLVNYELTFTNQPKIRSNFKDGFYNYGDFLTGNNLNVYNAFMNLDGPTDDTITIKLADPITIKLSALPNSSKFSDEDQEAYETALFENCKPGIDSALFDRPELYWIEPSGMSVSVGEDTTVTPGFFSGGYTVKIRSLNIIPQWLEGFSSKAEAIQYGVLLDEALEKVPVSGNNRYEILNFQLKHLSS